MSRHRLLSFLGMCAALLAPAIAPGPLFAGSSSEGAYEVLSPWAEVDAVPLRGLSPRLDDLAGKKVGMFVNYKRAARPIALSLEKRLKAMFPGTDIRPFYSPEWNVLETETKNRDQFEAGARGVAAVILLVGD